MSVSVDVIMIESEYHIANFEENTSEVCKVGWEDGQNVFARIFTNNELWSDQCSLRRTTKDTTYDIPQLPLILYFGSNGKLILSRFVDLRRDFLNDDACRAIN